MTKTAKLNGALLVAATIGLTACDALQITGGPLAIGAAQEGNLLDHGGFERGFGAWRACGDPSLITTQSNDDRTESSAIFAAGGCLFQTQPAVENDNMIVSCTARKDTLNWASVTFGYLDSDFQPLKSVEAPIPDINFTEVTAELRAPVDTAHVEVLIYTEDGAEVDGCVLINTQQGQGDELLTNSYFEDDLSGWQSCATGVATVENDVAEITDSCITQTFAASIGNELQFTCDATKTGDGHAAVAVGFLDSDYGTVAVSETPVSTEEGLFPTVNLTAPESTAFTQVMVYAQGVLTEGVYNEGAVSVNNCSLQYPSVE